MNRIVRSVLSSAAVVGGLVGAAPLANAQTVNVAPPAYAAATATPPARDAAYTAYAPYAAYAAYGWDGYARDGGQARSYERARHERLERAERARRAHARECARAYHDGAPWWALRQMRCGS